MLRGNYAGEIALAVAGLPQAARSAASLVDAGLSATGNAAAKSRIAARALARELEAAEPALAAKTPSVGPEQVRHQIGDTTPTMVREGPKITATGENVPTSKTAGPPPTNPAASPPAPWSPPRQASVPSKPSKWATSYGRAWKTAQGKPSWPR